jgi:hypothetical protein
MAGQIGEEALEDPLRSASADDRGVVSVQEVQPDRNVTVAGFPADDHRKVGGSFDALHQIFGQSGA